jgi:hypothetical protein
MRFAFAVVVGLIACKQPPLLSTTEQEAVIVLPSSYDFGSLQVGQMSGAFVDTIRPAFGANYDIVQSITGCSDFPVDAPNLPAEVYRFCDDTCDPKADSFDPAECPVIVENANENAACIPSEYLTYSFNTFFRPTVAGPLSCGVTIALGDGTLHTLSLSGTGTAPPIDIDVAPGGIAFGDVRRDTDSSPSTVTIRNLGSANLELYAVSTAAPFSAAGPGPGTIPPGGLQQYAVRCHPTAVGVVSGQLTVQSNDPATGTVAVALSCNGVDSNIDITPSPATLNPTRVGEPIEQVISVSNSGGAATTIESVYVVGAGITMIAAPPGLPRVFNPGEKADVGVRFEAAAAGDASASLTVTYDGGQTRTSQITALALTASMSLHPDGEVNFGPVCAGETKVKGFTILGNADGPFEITQIDEPGVPFVASLPGLPAAVQPRGGNQVTFDLEVVPEAVGPITGTLTIVTDIPNAAPHQVQLMAAALAPGIGATPETVDLGSNQLDTTTLGQPVEITNCTEVPLMLLGARIEGVDAADFAIVANPDSMTVSPKESGRYLVVFTARTAGAKHAELIVDHSAGTTIIPLDAEGLGPLDGIGGRNRISYYACSVGGLAGWPIALVLVLLFRRRRGSREHEATLRAANPQA